MPQIPIIQTQTRVQTGSVDMRGAGAHVVPVLSGAVGMGADIFERYQQAQMARIALKVTGAQSKVDTAIQNDMAEEAAKDDKEGPFSKRMLRRYDQRVEEEMGKLSSKEQKIFRQRSAERRARLEPFLMGEEIKRREEGLVIETERGIEEDGRAIATDPSNAAELIARRLAQIDTLLLPQAARQKMADRARSMLAENAAAGLLRDRPDEIIRRFGDGKPETIKNDAILGNLPPDKLAHAISQARKADGLSRAQSAADEIMGKGMSLDEAMKYAEKNYSGHDEHALKAELASRFNYMEAARKDREQEAYGTALLEVEQRGKVTPGTWGRLTDAHRAAILNRQQAEAKQRRMEAEGKPVKTDWDTYLRLRELADSNPQEFARTDLRQYVDKIGPGQMEQLLDLRSKLTSSKPPREAVTLTQQTNATLASLGIKSAEKKGKFLTWVQAEVDQATDAKGKPLTFEERQQIIDRAVLKGPDPDRLLPWGERYFFELSPGQRSRFKPNAPTDAPASEVEALNEALRAQGIPQTAENRLALYRRAMTKGAQ